MKKGKNGFLLTLAVAMVLLATSCAPGEVTTTTLTMYSTTTVTQPTTTTVVSTTTVTTTQLTTTTIVSTTTVTAAQPTTTTTLPATTTPAPLEELSVHFIDVGQGDSIFIDYGSLEVLIDGGEKSPGVVTYIDDYVDDSLDLMIATHPHADHIGGLIDVLAAFQVGEVWLNGEASTSQTYSQFMAAVETEGCEARRLDMFVVLDETSSYSLTFRILNPEDLDDDTNNNSIVVWLSFGEIDFLFQGDAEQEAEQEMLDAGLVPNVEILKVGHHGSRTSSSWAYLEATTPEVAIYMSGEGNQYGHPHEETISALQSIGADVYGTDVCGTIIVTTDGVTYKVETEN